MKSAVFYGKHDLRVEESKKPEIGPKDVLIQVKACGVCGTDVHIYEGDKGAAEVTPPTILGHEFSGVVAQTGAEVVNCKVGDRVCIDPNCYCGTCEPCRNGAAHYCENMIGYGTTVNGGFAEYCAVNERQVYLLGENTTFEQGAMAEPVACCLHGIDMCEIQPGHQVVVIGGGMIGLLMMQLANLAGAAKVALLEPVENKREVAKKLGADICIDPIKEDVQAVLKAAGMTWINTVIECVGRPSTIRQAIDIAGNKAVVMMFGLTKPDETIQVKPFEVFQKELVLKASFINPYTQKRALDLIDTRRLDVSSMIYEVCGLENLEGVLSKPELRANGKYIISPEK
ncbi:zinc-dependent alcohol dehydrogenase family protein [Robinsoniella peoriensis]|uniref:Putative zinc-type alcohol dehydrogenase-like protein YjmD n=1 Tax=Robinsoniella peoriensis TaxID=180332 RepID=A0A4U8Q7U6_9FIRM|nr:zinc-dependent alcohol dehydrogenase family protein [Robinsoniella peoriensis]TLC97815.1 putative zinc-type alcohol dehydrogenase-like protein YjmD [Robinsoniella peoriensis]